MAPSLPLALIVDQSHATAMNKPDVWPGEQTALGFETNLSHRDSRTAVDTLSITGEEFQMNWERVEGNWKQIKGSVKEQWGKLTDDQLDVIAGKRDQLAGKIEEAYGISKDEVEKQLAAWQDKFNATFGK